MDYRYARSSSGNITSKETEHGSYDYAYDKLYQLIEATRPDADAEAYTYDALGNRLTDASHDGLWSYNANNQLLAYADVSYEYDDNGNRTRKLVGGVTAFRYIYDVENRLVRVERGDGTTVAAYYYDPFGRRLWKEVDGVRTYFLYADEGLVGEYDAEGNAIRTYGYAPDSVWSTNPLFQKAGGAYYWYQNDHLGVPQKMLDTSGRIVWSALYDSFGNITIGSEAIINNLRLAGQYHDEETGLYYNWNRFYDPKIGRYISADLIGLAGGMNLYAYVQNDPVNLMDPLGLDEHHVIPKAIWKDLPIRDDVRKFLNGFVVEAGEHNNRYPHGSYNAHIRNLWDDFFRGLGLEPKQISDCHIRAFADKIKTDPKARELLIDIIERGGMKTLPPWLKNNKNIYILKRGGAIIRRGIIPGVGIFLTIYGELIDVPELD
jgi:RHS repeat-associated protein